MSTRTTMETDRIARLLRPFMTGPALAAPGSLSEAQLRSISTYIELLLRWNARINLTAVRDAESIVTRHFGESFFLAARLFAGPAGAQDVSHALDLGSGAGFPGLPLKIYAPDLHLTLAESNHKKAAFLNEVIRSLNLKEVSVFAGRLETRRPGSADAWPPRGIEPPDLVTMRAVERFESALATAAALVRSGATVHGVGRLALLLGESQAQRVPQLLSDFLWQPAILVPESRQRVLLIGAYPGKAR